MSQELFLYETLSERLAEHIRRGGFIPGERLPSVRALSKAFGVSINTTVQSLRKLEMDGYIEVRDRSGAYVRHALPRPAVNGNVSHFPVLPVEISLSEEILRFMEPHISEQALHLGIALPDPGLMPVERIMRLWRDASRRHARTMWDYSHPNGMPAMRRQLSIRSIGYDAGIGEDDILVTNGCMEAMELALRAVTKPGDVVAVESPTYYGTLLALDVLQRRAVEIPTHYRDGICLYTLEQVFRQGQVKACILSCNAQNPLGYVMTDERKQRLVEMASRYQVPVIENDIWGDTVYAGNAQPAKALDHTGMVIYCNSFSKSLMPGLRLGWVAAGRFHDRLRELKQISSITTAAAPQLVMSRFIESGAYAQHLVQLRAALEQQVTEALELVRESFPSGTWVHPPEGGCVLWVKLPEHRDSRKLFQQALNDGIHIFPGSVFSVGPRHSDFMRLNVGSGLTPEVREKLRRLGALVAQMQ
jgi:DNA-binding transcriptional MocR family regulator